MKSNGIGILIMNLIIAVLVVALIFTTVDMFGSSRYAKERRTAAAEHTEYDIAGKSYEEVVDHYNTKVALSSDPEEGDEDLYKVGEYCHLAFMSKVYRAEGKREQLGSCNDKMKALEAEMGQYSYVPDEVLGIIGCDPD